MSLRLLQDSLAPSTRIVYKHAIAQFKIFHKQFYKHKSWFPISTSTLAKYVAYLHTCNYKPSSISTKVAALGHIHSLSNNPNPTNQPIIIKMLKGASKSNSSQDTRQPISKEILHNMLKKVSIMFKQQYAVKLYSAMILLAFHALLRIGEYTLSHSRGSHTLKVSNISFSKSNKNSEMQIHFEHFKHSKKAKTLTIDRNQAYKHCTVKAVQTYLKMRPSKSKRYLFVNQDGTAVTSSQFGKVFKQIIQSCNLSTKIYKPHSLRIGGATWAHSKNLSDSQIQELGRWNSNAFKKYIRVQLVSH